MLVVRPVLLFFVFIFFCFFQDLLYLCTMKMKYQYILLVVWLWTMTSISASAQRNVIHSDRIASLQVRVGDRWQEMPVAKLGEEQIVIAFDDMTHNLHRFSYELVHCDADWSESKGLFASDFLQGFNGELTIDNSQQSINTNHLYTHYQLTIPNENCRFTMSGNYKLTVFDDDCDHQPMLTACFMILEPLMQVSMSYSSNTDVDVNRSHQQVQLSVDYGRLRVSRPKQQVKTVVLQNARWDNAVVGAEADFVNADGLQYRHNRALIFDAGNEYRKFEMLDLNHTTMGIDEIRWDGKDFHAYLFPDRARPSYVYDEGAKGAFYIRNSDNVENDFASDYAWVHFQLDAPLQEGTVYLNGNWTHDSFFPSYQMVYDEESRSYRGCVLLKQGYYSYQYLVLHGDGSTSPVTSEGSYFQTANTYQTLVYYRGIGERTDRLVGYAAIK